MLGLDLDMELKTNLELPNLHDIFKLSSALALLLGSLAFHGHRAWSDLGYCCKSLEGL